MKMSKIESARIIAQSTDNPVCRSILCSSCFNSRKGKTCKDGNLMAIEKAKAYIKRHEQKSKKKDHIRDATKKVEEPKPVKTVGIDNSDVTFARPTVKENLSVPCKHLINGDACGNPFDHCDKDCPANSEYPQPIKLPDFVYYASKNGVGFIDTKNRTFNTNDKGELLINDKPCFATPEEALQVAKKLWQGEKK